MRQSFPKVAYEQLQSGDDRGVQVITRPLEFSLTHAPAAATQATATKTSVAGHKHVVSSVSATFATGATAQATALVFQIRQVDTITGTSTIVWSKQVILNTNSVWEFNTTMNLAIGIGCNLIIEFASAGVAGSFESFSATGYTVQVDK